MTNKQHLVLEISDEIMKLIDSADDMPRGDLQGCVEALAIELVERVV